MGQGSGYRCPKCGYRLDAMLGAGFAYPHVYEETVAKMKSGELGEEAKQFFVDHPDGAVNAENELAVCKECGRYDTVPALKLYVPKEGYVHRPAGRWSVAVPAKGVSFVAPWDLEDHYVKVGQLKQHCQSCGGTLKILSERTIARKGLTCPCCGERLVEEEQMFWD